MENLNLQRDIKSFLQINGPILSFVKHPQSITVGAGETVTFTGIATAVFPTQDPANPAVGLGTIAYRWYEVGGDALVDDDVDGVGGSIAGAGSTYLHINSPQAADRGKQYYLTADYISNYPDPVVGFGTTTPVTPNATNDPISSDSATLELYPEIEVTKHPENFIGGEGVKAEFEVDANMSFEGFGDVSYQWRLDGENLNDVVGTTGLTTSFKTASETTVADIEQYCVLALPLWNGGSGGDLIRDYVGGTSYSGVYDSGSVALIFNGNHTTGNGLGARPNNFTVSFTTLPTASTSLRFLLVQQSGNCVVTTSQGSETIASGNLTAQWVSCTKLGSIQSIVWSGGSSNDGIKLYAIEVDGTELIQPSSTLNLTDYCENAKKLTPGTTSPSFCGYPEYTPYQHFTCVGGGTPSWETNTVAASNFYGGAAFFDQYQSEYLNIQGSEDFDFGTGDFCFEMWYCPVSGSKDSWEVLMCPSGGSYGDGGIWFTVANGSFYIASISGYKIIGKVDDWEDQKDKWHHIACTREGGTVRFFWNGQLDTKYMRTDRRQYGSHGGMQNTTAAGGGYIGMERGASVGHENGFYYPHAYMQDLKIYKGVAKYIESFTPSTTSIIEQKNTIVYSDYTTVRSVQADGAIDLFDGDFEDSVYLWTDNVPDDYIEIDFSSWEGGGYTVVSTVSIYVQSASTTGELTLTNSSGTATDFSPTTSTGWQIFSWSGTLAKVYIKANSGASSDSFNPSAIKIDDLVLLDPVDTVSTFTSGFPSTLAIPFWNGSGEDVLTLKDVSQGNHKVEKYNAEPKWSSTGGKWYSGYALFNEDADPRSDRAVQISKEGKVNDFIFGTGDFTVECWVYPIALGNDDIFSTGTYLMDQLTIRKNASEQLEVYWNDTIISNGGTISLDVWQNIAVSRKDGYVMLYIDGVRVARSKFVQSISANVPVLIGAAAGNSFNWRGGIQDFVVYNNIAKYTENFVFNSRSILSFDRGISAISGSRTNKLTITPVNSGSNSVDCLLTNLYATSVITYSANMVTTEPRSVLRVEAYDSTSEADLYSYNLDDEEFSINSDSINSDEICFYSPEKDMDIEMDLYGAKGEDWISGSVGGEGGYSRIRFTMKKNEEYVLKGIKSNSALFLYRKASLIAVVGQGGAGGPHGDGREGGSGGGVSVAGSDGTSQQGFPGDGGPRIGNGELTENGTFGGRSNIASVYPGDSTAPSTPAGLFSNTIFYLQTNGGQTIKCTKGVYWRDQGKSSCEDLGTIQYRTKDGTVVTNSVLIDRGFKSGYAINTTGGSRGDSDGGNGGNGATGGTAGSSSGGGGGSGYSDGSITIVDTKLGGSAGNAKVIIRIADPDTIVSSTTLEEVSFSVGRSAAYSNTITFVKESGTGPDRITFGPNAGTVSVSLVAGAVYTRESVLINGAAGGNVRLSGGVLQLEDSTDGDYNDLTVTPNKGKFTSASRYEFT